ncbi:helix-turn-helix domain-containing protein, partial [Nocardia farcinica]|uniref:helix-turn-helix domain-containing protein n=1 Tax=Nocardia farcinica TaxID=37329 RepID=UPI00397F3E44
DVVRVARNRDEGVTLDQIAADFGIHPMTLSKWMRQADVDEGVVSGHDILPMGGHLRPRWWPPDSPWMARYLPR